MDNMKGNFIITAVIIIVVLFGIAMLIVVPKMLSVSEDGRSDVTEKTPKEEYQNTTSGLSEAQYKNDSIPQSATSTTDQEYHAVKENKQVAKPPRTIDPRSKFKVKGLYIGMDIKEAWAIMGNLLAGNSGYELRSLGAQQGGSYCFCVLTNSEAKYYDDHPEWMPAYSALITCESNGKVKNITFKNEITNYLFNVSDMKASDFAQEFINAYKIPKMERANNCWIYTHPYGVEVTITDACNWWLPKEIIIDKVPAAGERAFD